VVYYEAEQLNLLEDRVALITGASSGIGKAAAMLFAESGCKVILVGRRQSRLAEVVDEIQSHNGQAIQFAVDVTEERQVNSLVEKAHGKWKKLDILVNCAGIMLLNPVVDANPEEWRSMISVNLLGPMYLIHAVLPVMKSQGGGHIVNISSTAGRFASPNAAVYSATKFGIRAFSDALRKEVAHDNIRITVIEPGATDTEISEQLTNPQIKEQVNAWTSSIRQLDPADVARAILYAVTQPKHVSINEILIPPLEHLL
jgi:NADP-dependent 3-hydroxy acid dehydrogenase YdfG